jgi:HD-GYP domain-containing protein (c-di-GMP phosphodiesterase class II)
MHHNINVNLGNLVLSLSDAIDLASPQINHHQQRTAYIVWQMCEQNKTPDKIMEHYFIAALLHDIGALSIEEKINLRNHEVENAELHCLRGSILLDKIPWLNEAGKLIRFHHREWQNWNESIDDPVVFGSQMIFLADFIERQINNEVDILNQNQSIITKLRENTGRSFHPMLEELFLAVSTREEFWMDLVSPRLYSILLNEGPFRNIRIEFLDITVISELFRNIIDFRSRFTSTHSSGVAACASILSRIFGLTEAETELMNVAGNIHDLGKLVIPNIILDKPGALSEEERNIMKCHTYYTYHIVSTIDGLEKIAEWGAFHHERLDGSGYPFHCKEHRIDTNARIMMVADIFTALAENRPYRVAMSRNEICKIFKSFADRDLLDRKIINLVFENFEEIHSYVIEKQAQTQEYYEKQF